MDNSNKCNKDVQILAQGKEILLLSSDVKNLQAESSGLGRANAALRTALRYEKAKVKELVFKLAELQELKDLQRDAFQFKCMSLTRRMRELEAGKE